MSCWVVPTVAAEYWGVTLDVVRQRVCDGLIPHKTEQGFVFLDVDPWTVDSVGRPFHPHPLTYLSTPIDPGAAVHSSSTEISLTNNVEDLPPTHDPDGAHCENETNTSEIADELSDEESATFARLSWEEVRSRVSRARRPPPRRRAPFSP